MKWGLIMRITAELVEPSRGFCSIRLRYTGESPVTQVDAYWRAGLQRDKRTEPHLVQPGFEDDGSLVMNIPLEEARQGIEIHVTLRGPLGDRVDYLFYQKYRLEEGPQGFILTELERHERPAADSL